VAKTRTLALEVGTQGQKGARDVGVSGEGIHSSEIFLQRVVGHKEYGHDFGE
jgi:hypothetical protein